MGQDNPSGTKKCYKCKGAGTITEKYTDYTADGRVVTETIQKTCSACLGNGYS